MSTTELLSVGRYGLWTLNRRRRPRRRLSSTVVLVPAVPHLRATDRRVGEPAAWSAMADDATTEFGTAEHVAAEHVAAEHVAAEGCLAESVVLDEAGDEHGGARPDGTFDRG